MGASAELPWAPASGDAGHPDDVRHLPPRRDRSRGPILPRVVMVLANLALSFAIGAAITHGI